MKMSEKFHMIKYDFSDLLYQSFWWCKSRSNNPLETEESLSWRYSQFWNDFDRLNKEIDIVNIVTTVKDLKYATNDIVIEIENLKSKIEELSQISQEWINKWNNTLQGTSMLNKPINNNLDDMPDIA